MPEETENPFGPYRAAVGQDWLATDRILQSWHGRVSPDAASRKLVEWAASMAGSEFARAADLAELPDNLPRLRTPMGGAPTADDVVLPAGTLRTLAAVHGSGIWSPAVSDRARYAAIYLLAQNGEAGVMCSVACTDGLLRALRKLGSGEKKKEIVRAIEASTPERFVHGAQFVTEIQGGSDAAANRVRAEPQPDGSWRLFGQKWFCSNLTADHWLVTARPAGAPEGAKGVALFLVAKHHDGKPNGHVVERLKEKVGTRALATAELRFEGAVAWPVGPLDEGLKNMVATVLAASRVHNVLASAATLRAAARHARAYAEHRHAFGKPIAQHPLLRASLERIEQAANRTEAAAFSLVDLWLRAESGPPSPWARVILSIGKAVTARRCSRLTYEAMMAFGGNGIEERFGPLPRLWRDAAIYETWEGPYTLLLMQALEDLVRFGIPGKEAAFLRESLGGAALESDAMALAYILDKPENPGRILEWELLAELLWSRFEDRAVKELRAPTPPATPSMN